MSRTTPDPLTELQRRLDYTFRDASLLERALTHPSVLPERSDLTESNQRLEYLGDAVLQLILTEQLFALYPAEREGMLSRRRAALANRGFLANLAREIGLDRCLLLGSGEEASGGRDRDSALGDAFEALLGAIHSDSDFDTTRRIVLGLFGPLEERLSGLLEEENPKGRLQELIQPVHGNAALTYELVSSEGPDHEHSCEVAVKLLDRIVGTGRGTSKKTAEEAAAREALSFLKKATTDSH